MDAGRRMTLQGVIKRIVMQDDVDAAVEFAKAQIRRLLSGRCELWELVMTGGLWRMSGQEVERVAMQGVCPSQPCLSACLPACLRWLKGERQILALLDPLRPVVAGAGEEEVKGPHAALAVRLQKRDPNRSFVLGERLQYVLLPGKRTQDEVGRNARPRVLPAWSGVPLRKRTHNIAPDCCPSVHSSVCLPVHLSFLSRLCI
jgi:DNA polymerase delta subunit 1